MHPLELEEVSHIYVSSEKASHCSSRHTSCDSKPSLGAMAYNQIVLTWMFLLKTSNFCRIVWVVKVVQRCDCPNVIIKATEIYEGRY